MLPSLRSSVLSWESRAGLSPTNHRRVERLYTCAELSQRKPSTGCRAATTPCTVTIKNRDECTRVELKVKKKLRSTTAREEVGGVVPALGSTGRRNRPAVSASYWIRFPPISGSDPRRRRR